jgi:hypothetical protein
MMMMMMMMMMIRWYKPQFTDIGEFCTGSKCKSLRAVSQTFEEALRSVK